MPVATLDALGRPSSSSLGTKGANFTVTPSSGIDIQTVTISASVTATLADASATGACMLRLAVKQDATGGRLLTLAGPAGGSFGFIGAYGNPVGQNTANGWDYVELWTVDGKNWTAIYTPTVTEVDAHVDAFEAITNTAYTDFTTVGPSVSILTGTRVLVTVGGNIQSSAGGVWQISKLGYVVSGATTIAAADGQGPQEHQISTNPKITENSLTSEVSVTAGVNTFKVQGAANAGTLLAGRRKIIVQRLN